MSFVYGLNKVSFGKKKKNPLRDHFKRNPYIKKTSCKELIMRIINTEPINTKYALKASDQDCHKLCVSEISASLKFLEAH